MAHHSKLFSKVPLSVQNLSGFDLSHENLFSAKCGTLTPCYVQPVIPNTKLTLSLSTEIQLPPMATDFYGKVDGVFEAFFVPYRILYGGWQELITRPVNNAVYPPLSGADTTAKFLPSFSIPSGQYGIGSLSDYLGLKVKDSGDAIDVHNPLFYLAYHKIYDDWYRNSYVQAPLFNRYSRDIDGGSQFYVGNLPFTSYEGDFSTTFQPAFRYGYLYSLRQRNWAKDYFTSATPLPQAGTDVKISINTEDNSFTWGQLVAQNSLARWMQRTNIAGYRYPDQILAGFGVLPPDAIMDRPIYLGRKIVPIYNKSVYQNSGSAGDSSNPFKTVAAKFGAPLGVGNGNLIKRFHAKEHGVFMVLFSMVPRAYYSTGTSRHFKAQTMADFPHPDFANMGDQPIFMSELVNQRPNMADDSTFAYQAKDSHYKYIDDQVHGELRDGGSLSMFALQRSFSINPELSSSFLEIPTDFMDQVAAVDGDVSKYGCWVDVHFKAKSSMPLPAASIPTLSDPRDVHTVMVDKGGRTL